MRAILERYAALCPSEGRTSLQQYHTHIEAMGTRTRLRDSTPYSSPALTRPLRSNERMVLHTLTQDRNGHQEEIEHIPADTPEGPEAMIPLEQDLQSKDGEKH